MRLPELALAVLVALLVAAVPLRQGLLEPGEYSLLAPDTATVHLPWSARLAADGALDPAGGSAEPVVRPRHPGLSDQALFFYPVYRFVCEAWKQALVHRDLGHAPLWNPQIYFGAPCLGNPQAGVLDPQVLALAPLTWLAGDRGFHLGLVLTAWLRLALAGLGAYCLARRLGFRPPAASLSGLGFAGAGFSVAWLGHSLGHVTPFLPWMLFACEGTCGARPGRSAALLGVLFTGSVLAGHPETSFYAGVAVGLWALALLSRDRTAGVRSLTALVLGTLCALPVLLPFIEYLGESAARALREASLARPAPDWVALGGVLVAFAVALRAARHTDERAAGAELRAAAGIALLVLGLVVLLVARGLPEAAGLSVVSDRLGRPGFDGGYRGGGSYPEVVSGWSPTAVLALAFAGAFARRGPLPARGLVVGLGFVALLLVLHAPGLIELKRWIPVVGLGAPVRLAVVSSLFLALLAGEALERAPRAPRWAGVLVVGALAAALALPSSALGGGGAPEPLAPEQDEWIGFVHVPPPVLDGEQARFEGWIAPEVEFERAALRVSPLDDRARASLTAALEAPVEVYEVTGSALPTDAPERARTFRAEYLQSNRLGPGTWAFELVLYGSDGEQVATRTAARSLVERGVRPSALSLALIVASLLAVLGIGRLSRWTVTALALVQVVWFAEAQNPAVPAAEAYPRTRTEAVLAAELGARRFASDPGVLPPSSGIVRGLRSLDGYDGMDPKAFNDYRPLILKPEVHGLLGFHARGLVLDGPTFDLTAVSHLALREPLEHPRWWLVSSPPSTETWLYRCIDPGPVAWIAPEVLPFAEVRGRLERGETWDPRRTAAYDGTWRPTREPTRVELREVARGASLLGFEVELDGDGMLCLSEQYFPGWRATVNGERVDCERVNAVFRGVPLGPGRSTVELRYWPTGLTPALSAALAGLVGLVLLALRGRGA